MSWLSSLFSHDDPPYVAAANEQTKLMEGQQAKHDADVAAARPTANKADAS